MTTQVENLKETLEALRASNRRMDTPEAHEFVRKRAEATYRMFSPSSTIEEAEERYLSARIGCERAREAQLRAQDDVYYTELLRDFCRRELKELKEGE